MTSSHLTFHSHDLTILNWPSTVVISYVVFTLHSLAISLFSQSKQLHFNSFNYCNIWLAPRISYRFRVMNILHRIFLFYMEYSFVNTLLLLVFSLPFFEFKLIVFFWNHFSVYVPRLSFAYSHLHVEYPPPTLNLSTYHFYMRLTQGLLIVPSAIHFIRF